ncbi:MAG: hypothetical protein ABUL73_06530 [Alphaproteobacteria bacterium]
MTLSTIAPRSLIYPVRRRPRRVRFTSMQSWRRTMKRLNNRALWMRTRRPRVMCSTLGKG